MSRSTDCFLTGKVSQDIIENVILWNCQFIQFTGYTKEDVAALKEAGIKINFFGTDDPVKVQNLLNDGIDFPLVDFFTKTWSAAASIEGLEPNTLDANYLKVVEKQ